MLCPTTQHTSGSLQCVRFPAPPLSDLRLQHPNSRLFALSLFSKSAPFLCRVHFAWPQKQPLPPSLRLALKSCDLGKQVTKPVRRGLKKTDDARGEVCRLKSPVTVMHCVYLSFIPWLSSSRGPHVRICALRSPASTWHSVRQGQERSHTCMSQLCLFRCVFPSHEVLSRCGCQRSECWEHERACREQRCSQPTFTSMASPGA